MSLMSKVTPAIEQYLRVKAEYPDSILFFRMGDFYEMFFEDAKVASKALEIALTSRGKHHGEDVPLCGVPYHAADHYLARLVSQGFKVAICEQIEDPKQAKGIVRRAVTRVVTPGTALDPESLGKNLYTFIASICADGRGGFGLAQIDFSTGDFKCTELNKLDALFDELGRIEPKELILPEKILDEPEFKMAWEDFLNQLGETPLLNKLGDEEFDFQRNYERLCRHFEVESLDGFGLEAAEEAVIASGVLLGYLESTQGGEDAPAVEVGGAEPARLAAPLSHITDLRYYQFREFMILDEATKRNLELVKTLREGKELGSLFNLINLCITSVGSRTILDWLNYPLLEVARINERLDAVEFLKDRHVLRLDLRNLLARVSDLERLASRVSMKSANARDLIGIRESLKVIAPIRELVPKESPELLREIGSKLDPMPALLDLLERAISNEAPSVLHEGRLLKSGFNAELDELSAVRRDGKSYLARIETEERQKTGINSLKIGYNQVFGYYLEVTNPHLERVPEYFQRRQTLVNAERFITPELKELEAKILTAEDRSIELNYELFCAVREDVAKSADAIKKNARELGRLDAGVALAELAARRAYSRPEVDESDTIEIRAGRHPVIEALRPNDQFIPNDIYLDNREHQILIITGPNMAGKSTILRQTAVIVLMAQIGSFVPAERARIGVVDRIFTRVGASDVLVRGLSTFMVEMSETANILNNATARSLIILDEIGRGTSTFDGLSLAWAIVEFLHNQTGAKTLFATHYHELTELVGRLPRLGNFNVAVREWNDQIVFLRKIVEGGTDKSYGIQVARLAGVPKPVLDRAKVILRNLEESELTPEGNVRQAARHRAEREKLKKLEPPPQLDLFAAALPEA